ncbi:hypothetical protein NP233_g7695 [Leucocoprinus birnbaumii]|uniref:Zn(2)-C6 fungal-type domain-containing protein n=1 Tax=Leucocoprinus birnbaumii TaxID=56174 RepID=A0AAD5VNP1_9AGAR|nr:hypothetical protein NP233_g7695 [Leucocoprinus birnbaumii]
MEYRRISPTDGSPGPDGQHFTQPILKKGRACVNCRRRKMKCDGVQPVCGSCLRTEKAEDCEYTTGSERSTSQRLEDEVHRLQTRLRDLQRPSDPPQGVTLQQPYVPDASNRRQQSSLQEPPLQVAQRLLDTFLAHASQLGFFLHPGRFRSSVQLPGSAGHESRPAPSLLSTMYLLGIHLTEVLLAHYFFSNKRPVEAKYHFNAAYSLAIASGIHKMRTRNPPDSTLPPATDDIEEGERVNAYWAIFSADKEWAGVFSCNPNIPSVTTSASIRLVTPFPREIEEYETGRYRCEMRPGHTFDDFLAGGEAPGEPLSSRALHAKAAFLFERGRAFSRMSGIELSNRQRNGLGDDFRHIRSLALNLKATLPPFETWLRNPNIDVVRTAYVGLTLLDAALIRLHGVAATHGDEKAMQQRMMSAQNIFNNSMRLASASWNFGYLNPIIGIAWREAFDVLVDEIRNRAQSSWSARHPSAQGEDPLRRQIRKGVSSFTIYSSGSTFIRCELEEMTNILQGGSPFSTT